jgi:hypothetical protein
MLHNVLVVIGLFADTSVPLASAARPAPVCGGAEWPLVRAAVRRYCT